MTKTIEVIVTPAGESRIQTKGFDGASCREASKFLEEALGRRTDEQLTAEFYAPTTSQQETHQRG